MNQHTEEFDRLAESVWLHAPANGINRDGLATLGRIAGRLTDILACQRSQPDANLIRINSRAEPPKYALYSLQNFLRSESFGNDERLTAICLCGYLRSAVPALESTCPTMKKAS